MKGVLPDVIFTRSFPLNSSESKFAIAGVQLINDQWEPTVNLVSQFWFGTTLNLQEWHEFSYNTAIPGGIQYQG